jgi:hypothetical protein
MSHEELADALRLAVVSRSGVTPVSLRNAIYARAAGGPPVQEPYEALARQIGEASYRVTDAEVSAVRVAAGSDKGAFEAVMAACVGAGLSRWDAFVEALDASA